MSDDWRGWKDGKHDNRYKGVKRHSGQPSSKKIIIISAIICVLIGGYFIFQTYGIPQNIQNESNKIINNTGSTIQRISSQSQQSISNLQNSVTSTNDDTRVPIAVYDNCQTLVRTDLNNIVTICNTTNFGQKQFTFILPPALEQGLPSNQAFTFVKGYVYQYGTNDFKIGLYDQVGEKNYTVSLWQLP